MRGKHFFKYYNQQYKELKMQINLTGHHVDITDSLRDYVNEKFQRLERHFEQINILKLACRWEKIWF